MPQGEEYVNGYEDVFEGPQRKRSQQYWDYLVNTYGNNLKGFQDILVKDKYTIPENKGLSNMGYSLYYDELPQNLLEYKRRAMALDAPYVVKQPKPSLAPPIVNDSQERIESDFYNDPNSRYKLNQPKQTFYDLFANNNNIIDKAKAYTNFMMEGGNRWAEDLKKGDYEKKQPYYSYDFAGLDRIGDDIDTLIKKKYLNKDFKNKFKEDISLNEKDEEIKGGIFSNVSDLMTAMDARLRWGADEAVDIAGKYGKKLSKDEKDFWSFVHYNYGPNGMKMMMEAYNKAGILKNKDYLTTDPLGGRYGQIWKNASKRLSVLNAVRGEGVFNGVSSNNLAFGEKLLK